MKKQHEIDVTALGSYVALPNVEASPGRQVRFLRPCPMTVRGVYTRGVAHHYIPAGALATIFKLQPETDLDWPTVELKFRYRVRNCEGVPQSYLELLPKPLVVLGPLTEDNAYEGAVVEFCLPITVNGKSEFSEDTHHVINAGVRGRITRLQLNICDVEVEGRSRPVKRVPLTFLDLLGAQP